MSVVNAKNWTRQISTHFLDGKYPFSIRPEGSYPISTNKVSGHVPLAIHAETTLHESGPAESRFGDLDYGWALDMGGEWRTGHTKNISEGPLACGIYDTTGTKTLILVVISLLGGVVGVDSIDITVTSADDQYPTTNTVCINNVGDSDFTDAPAGAQTINTDSLSTISGYIQDNFRVLLKRGGFWTDANVMSIPATSDAQLHHYGDSQDPLPHIEYTGSATSTFLSLRGKTNVTVWGVKFTATVGNGSCFAYDSDSTNLLMYQNEVSGFAFSLNSSTNTASAGSYHDQIFFIDNDCDDHSNNAVYSGGERVCILGNRIRRSSGAHLVRNWYSYKGIYQFNDESGAATSGTGQHIVKFHGPEDSEIDPVPIAGQKSVRFNTRYNQIQYNISGGGCPWMYATGPQNGLQAEKIFDTRVKYNRIVQQYGVQSQQQATIGIINWGSYTYADCNVIDLTGGQSANSSFIECSVRGAEGPNYGNKFRCNSFFKDVAEGTESYRGIRISDSGVNDAYIADNHQVLINTNGNTIDMVLDSGTNTDIEGTTNISETSTDGSAAGFMLDPENATPEDRDYTPAGGSTAIGGGAGADVVRDFKGVTRTAPYDSGAYEVAA